MSTVSRKTNHSDSVVQFAITFAGTYGCFYIAESSVMGVSGVISVVVYAVLLAATAWPIVSDKANMEQMWHNVAWMYLTVLFTLAGLITANAIFTVENWCLARS
jgi:hypothetical protein